MNTCYIVGNIERILTWFIKDTTCNNTTPQFHLSNMFTTSQMDFIYTFDFVQPQLTNISMFQSDKSTKQLT